MTFQSPWRLLVAGRRGRPAGRVRGDAAAAQPVRGAVHQPARCSTRSRRPPGLAPARAGRAVPGHAGAAGGRLRPPTDEVRVPRERATVMVAVDVSPSMRRHRRRAGPAARRPRRRPASSSTGLPDEFNVGLVAFAGSARWSVAPVTDRAVLARRASTGSPRRGRARRAPRSARRSRVAAGDPDARTPQAARTRRRPGSCCSPTAPTPPAATPTRRPPRRSRPACRSTRSRSARGDGVDRPGGGSPCRCRWTARRCERSPSRPAAATTRRAPPTSCAPSTTTSAPRSATARRQQDVSARFIGIGAAVRAGRRGRLDVLVLPASLKEHDDRRSASAPPHADPGVRIPRTSSPVRTDPRPATGRTGGERSGPGAPDAGCSPAGDRRLSRPASGRARRRVPAGTGRTADAAAGPATARHRAPRAPPRPAPAGNLPADLVSAAAAALPGVVSVRAGGGRPVPAS